MSYEIVWHILRQKKNRTGCSPADQLLLRYQMDFKYANVLWVMMMKKKNRWVHSALHTVTYEVNGKICGNSQFILHSNWMHNCTLHIYVLQLLNDTLKLQLQLIETVSSSDVFNFACTLQMTSRKNLLLSNISEVQTQSFCIPRFHVAFSIVALITFYSMHHKV